MKYQLYHAMGSTVPNAAFYINENGGMTSFLFDPDNTDYQAYLKWLEAGNTPEAADAATLPADTGA